MFHNRQPSDDALLDAIEAAHIAKREEEIRLDREYEHPIDVSDLPPNSVARPGVPIAVRQRELDDIVEWLDGLIAKLPDGDEED